MEYKCKRCGYVGKHLSDLKKHFKRKTLCPAKDNTTSYEDLSQQIINGTYWAYKKEDTKPAPPQTPMATTTQDGHVFNIVKVHELSKDIRTEQEYEAEVNKGMHVLGITAHYFDEHPDMRILVTPELKMMLLQLHGS